MMASVMNLRSLCCRMASLQLTSPMLPVSQAARLNTPMLYVAQTPLSHIVTRHINIRHVGDRPNAKTSRKNYRFQVHYPEDGKYTIEHLKMTKLGGRDPETGRIVVGTLGGGAKRYYRWIDWHRTANPDGSVYEERVLSIEFDPNRSAFIALVGAGEKPRWILATANMKVGDLIRTFSEIPSIPVEAKEGDAHPVGALPTGTIVHSIEIMPGQGGTLAHAGGTGAVLVQKLGKKVVFRLPSKRQIAVERECMATVGQLSNSRDKIIGSTVKWRWLGNRSASGLWQRKTGYCGRKIRPLPPVKHFAQKSEPARYIQLSISSEDYPRRIIPNTIRVK